MAEGVGIASGSKFGKGSSFDGGEPWKSRRSETWKTGCTRASAGKCKRNADTKDLRTQMEKGDYEEAPNGQIQGEKPKKKKSKKTPSSEAFEENLNYSSPLEEKKETDLEIPSKTKEKKKKKDKEFDKQLNKETEDLEHQPKHVSRGTYDNEKKKKSSKKRKLMASDEANDSANGGKEGPRLMKEASSLGGPSPSVLSVAEMAKNSHAMETAKNSHAMGTALSVCGEGELKNGKDEDGCTKKQSSKKQTNGSSESKQVNRFQRINIDDVSFTDERLRDNSYWAKAHYTYSSIGSQGGAENGYGTKAQEVLGQVRGKNFRHEKTKKKRGTYKGGQIDVQPHSVKFNYSDEE